MNTKKKEKKRRRHKHKISLRRANKLTYFIQNLLLLLLQ